MATVRAMTPAEFMVRRNHSCRHGAALVRAELPDRGAADGEVVLGMIVTRRVGNAVTRNRAKRRIRAVVAELAGSGRLLPGAYVVSLSNTGPDDHGEFTRMLTGAFAGATRRARAAEGTGPH